MLSNICRPRGRSQLYLRYQHIGVCNTHEKKSEQCWHIKLNYVSIVGQLLARGGLEAYRSCSKRSHDMFPNLNLLGDGDSAVHLVSVDQRNALYWGRPHTVNFHPVSIHTPSYTSQVSSLCLLTRLTHEISSALFSIPVTTL
jgi:hypothetical protein